MPVGGAALYKRERHRPIRAPRWHSRPHCLPPWLTHRVDNKICLLPLLRIWHLQRQRVHDRRAGPQQPLSGQTCITELWEEGPVATRRRHTACASFFASHKLLLIAHLPRQYRLQLALAHPWMAKRARPLLLRRRRHHRHRVALRLGVRLVQQRDVQHHQRLPCRRLRGGNSGGEQQGNNRKPRFSLVWLHCNLITSKRGGGRRATAWSSFVRAGRCGRHTVALTRSPAPRATNGGAAGGTRASP